MMHYFGWKKDQPDFRDVTFSALPHTLQALPPMIDLRPGCSPIYDQGQLGSCTANAIAGAFDFERHKQGLSFINPSRLFIYYNERVMEKTVGVDAGAAIRDGIKSVNTQGVCPESEWPYVINKFALKPPSNCYTDALKDHSIQYAAVPQVLTQMKSCLAGGSPFVFGFTVYQSFETQQVATTGIVPMPSRREQVLGGHAVVAVGYDDMKQRFICRNSWGNWAQAGYFEIPYLYLTNPNLASDFWVISLIASN